jgi:hypothetical protein
VQASGAGRRGGPDKALSVVQAPPRGRGSPALTAQRRAEQISARCRTVVALARQLEGTRFSMSATCFGSQVEPPRRCLRVQPFELGCDGTRMAAALTSAIMGSTPCGQKIETIARPRDYPAPGRLAGYPPLPFLRRLWDACRGGTQGGLMESTRILAYITGTVDQELLLRNEYLAAENRILRAQLKGRLRLASVGAVTLLNGAPAPAFAPGQRLDSGYLNDFYLTAKCRKGMSPSTVVNGLVTVLDARAFLSSLSSLRKSRSLNGERSQRASQPLQGHGSERDHYRGQFRGHYGAATPTYGAAQSGSTR